MAYSALMTIDDLGADFEEVNVHHCEFEFSRKIDIKTGHVLSSAQAGLIHITIESTKNTTILDWLINAQRKEGTIVFKADTSQGPMNSKKLTFTNALCVDYKEVFEAMTGNAMSCYFSIWCPEITVGDSEYTVEWMKDENEERTW